MVVPSASESRIFVKILIDRIFLFHLQCNSKFVCLSINVQMVALPASSLIPQHPLCYQVDKQFLVVEHYGMQFCFILCWIGLPSVIRQAYKLFKQCCIRDSMDKVGYLIQYLKRSAHIKVNCLFSRLLLERMALLMMSILLLHSSIIAYCYFFHHLINYFHQNLSSFALCMWYRKNI